MTPAARKLLVADGDKDSRFFVRMALRDFKVNFMEAGTPSECIQKALSFSPDLIIINYILGEDTGYHTAEKIKRIEKLRDVPIIIVTLEGFDLTEDHPCIEDFIEKPFSKDRLVSVIRDVLGRRMFLSKTAGAASASRKSSARGSGKRKILIADDDEDIVKLVELILSGKFEVNVARSGGELVEKGLSGNYDLIISDVIMPQLSGWKAARKLRDAGIMIPIIFNSGLVKDRDLYETHRPEGPSAFLLKPYGRNKLLSKIEEMI